MDEWRVERLRIGAERELRDSSNPGTSLSTSLAPLRPRPSLKESSLGKIDW